MSQPGHPSEINPIAYDGAANTINITCWLRPNAAAAALFKLAKSQHKCKSPVWNFFHRVEGTKTGVPDKDLPLKWLENCNDRSFMCCNGC
ncbi:hypothetical protein IV203_015493 [Nitzschia inconspicua]|uniref:Uncharacterized protein n=1 Tax=Nitzschia inconspicua TaxID=303405 RepID=A0A9K3PVP9_9STRA|nr:hypothetical protein IV203_015493 [Nitzschia inconspicua]